MAKMKKETEIQYEIVQHLGVLSENEDGTSKLEVNIESWNGGEAKMYIRNWKYDEYGERIRCGKMMGITMDNVNKLKEILNDIEF